MAGVTPGSFRITESGAAEYRIPIRVPQGVAGMEPRLALTYNSQSGNGLLGAGWNLEGLSAIIRCPRTMAQDGVRGGVNYDLNDRYCLDGQRLVAISGAYGADGTEYRTERESFVKVISYGTAGNGPAWFEAWTKSGEIIEYGNTVDSRIEAQGKPTVRAWAVNKISDTKQNFIEIAYYENSESGEFVPVGIAQKRSDGATMSWVQLEYEPRPDVTFGYAAGSMIQSYHRLKLVKPHTANGLAREYRIAYDVSPATGRSRAVSVQECDAGAACYPPTAIQWTDSATGTFSSAGSVTQYYGWGPVAPGDFDGDGKMDYIINTQTAGAGWYVYFSDGDGTFTRRGTATPYHGWHSLTTGDFNADGKTDFVINTATAGAGWYVYFSNGDGTFTRKGTLTQYHGWTGATTGDFNGDGRSDILINTQTAGAGWFVYLSNGDGSFSHAGTLTTYIGWTSPRVGDFNGDGKSDVLINTQTAGAGWFAYLSNGNGSFTSKGSVTPYPGWHSPALGDFNGDGNTDFLINTATANAGWFVYLSKGDGTFASKGSITPYPGWSGAVTGDFNGDGRDDYLINTNTSGAGWFIYRSKGDGTFTRSGTLTVYYGWRSPTPADYTGDGKEDVLINTMTSGAGWFSYRANTANAPLPDLVASVTDGAGVVVTPTYRPLTDGSVYAKDDSAVYPMVDMQSSLHVVSQASVSNGVGGTLAVDHAYAGLRSSLDGRGILGFRSHEATDQASGVKSRSEFRQDWPYVGLPSSVTRAQSSGAVLSDVANTYQCVDPATGGPCTVAPGGRYLPQLVQRLEAGNDLNGTVLPTVSTITQYDEFGNATQVTVSAGDGYAKSTSNVFVNDVPNWLLGRLKTSTVQSTVP